AALSASASSAASDGGAASQGIGSKLAAVGASAASNANAAAGGQTNEPFYAIGWTIKGTYNKTALSGEGKLGGVLALQNA
ncbi:hypothetical protein, partial [Burkholderia sp. SIMBA_048]